jgi:hypothetical protein
MPGLFFGESACFKLGTATEWYAICNSSETGRPSKASQHKDSSALEHNT